MNRCDEGPFYFDNYFYKIFFIFRKRKSYIKNAFDIKRLINYYYLSRIFDY